MPVVPPPSYGHEGDKAPRCCCGSCCRVTTCVYIIATIEALGLISSMITGVTVDAPTKEGQAGKYTGIVSFVLGSIVVGMMVCGVYKKRAPFLIPHLVFQVLGIIMAIAMCALYALGAGHAAKENLNEETKGLLISVAIVCVTTIGFEVWVFMIVFKCYRHLKTK